jgi:hypothetical protein
MKPRPSALASRIRRLMLADDDVGKVAAATPGVIGERSGPKKRVRVCITLTAVEPRLKKIDPTILSLPSQAAPWNSFSTASSKPPPPS